MLSAAVRSVASRGVKSVPLSFSARRALRCSPVAAFIEDEKTLAHLKTKEVVASKEFFEDASDKNRETFKNALEIFSKRDVRKRGQVEFIRAALKNMKAFGVERDLEVYKAIVDIMPKGKYVPENKIQATFQHFPKHQDCIVDVLSQMQHYDVVPDSELGQLIENIFGIDAKPYKKYMRMIYWMNKFKNLSPWPVPHHMPKDTKEIARLAIERITSVDRNTRVKDYDCQEIAESLDKTWIVSGQSPEQRRLIAEEISAEEALYVEGAFRVWVRDVQVNYFILRGAPVPPLPPPEGDSDDVSHIPNWVMGRNNPQDLVRIPSMHEQEDGTILACCATGTSSKDSLLSWVRFLQRENPRLGEIPILFTLTSPLGPVVGVDGDQSGLAAS